MMNVEINKSEINKEKIKPKINYETNAGKISGLIAQIEGLIIELEEELRNM